MKSKGVLFVLMGLILSLLLLGFAFKINSAYLKAEKKLFNSDALEQVKNKYYNLNSIRDFYRQGTTKSYFERIAPFTYSIDGNKISFTQKIPLKKATRKGFFDFINAYKIFIESDNSLIKDDINVSMETPRNSYWGGTDENILFIIKPQCMKYSVTDYNSMHFYASTECENQFDVSSIERIDINISLPSNADYNFLSCDFGGDTNCYQEVYVELNADPFIEINFLDENCSSCDLNASTRKVSKHFSPSADNTIILSCVGSCNSLPIKVFFNANNTEIRHSGKETEVKTQFLFVQKIEEFELHDVNLTLTDNRFNITKTNK
jgi:hypothetical protein